MKKGKTGHSTAFSSAQTLPIRSPSIRLWEEGGGVIAWPDQSNFSCRSRENGGGTTELLTDKPPPLHTALRFMTAVTRTRQWGVGWGMGKWRCLVSVTYLCS
jgi:hypothetical protein